MKKLCMLFLVFVAIAAYAQNDGKDYIKFDENGNITKFQQTTKDGTVFQLPDLYAGKMHALVFRNWKSRVKGRDWYDFEWYVRWQVPLDFMHLQERIREFNGEVMSIEDFKTALKERLSTTNIEDVKTDVRPFLKNDPHELDIWSNDYFQQLADRIVFKE